MKTQAVYYRDKSGSEPVDQFIDGIKNAKAQAKIDLAIETHVNGKDPSDPPAEFPNTSQVEGELRELRVDFASTRYRVLYQRSKNLIVLLHAIEKATPKLPPSDKELAKKRMDDFKARMDAMPRKKPRAAGKDAPGSSRKGS